MLGIVFEEVEDAFGSHNSGVIGRRDVWGGLWLSVWHSRTMRDQKWIESLKRRRTLRKTWKDEMVGGKRYLECTPPPPVLTQADVTCISAVLRPGRVPEIEMEVFHECRSGGVDAFCCPNDARNTEGLRDSWICVYGIFFIPLSGMFVRYFLAVTPTLHLITILFLVI